MTFVQLLGFFHQSTE